jgi:2-polyprenyl-6-methoxyphenol hydroxylase-like FAD-dependent oxidoreductase
MAETSVLIVGAGPTGLTLACDLSRRNIDFRLIDKAPAYFVGSRGKGLQPRSLEVFDDLGIVERIVSHGRFHLPFRSYDGAKILGDRDPHEGQHPTRDVPYASTLMIPQWRVEETLRQLLEANGKHVELSTELISIEQDDNGVTATIQKEGGQEQVHCQYLVAADGGRSFVRKFMKFGFEGQTVQEARMFVGDVCVDGLDRDHWHTWPNHPDGWLALCPFPTTESFQLQAAIPPGADENPSLEVFQQIVDQRTQRSDLKLYNPTWLSLYRVNIRMVDRYRDGRVFLAGDAAHVHPPTGGQGMNTGIQDSYNLGWKLGLVLAGANPSLLDTYEEERLPVAASVLGISTRLAREFIANKNQISRSTETLQLGINYRHSSLSHHEGSPESSLQAGDRAPDGPLPDTKGNGSRLFDLFRGPHFTLLSIGDADSAGLCGLGERFKENLRTYAIRHAASYQAKEPMLVLVRPDGYIGWLTEGNSIASAESYLKELLNKA